ncbi:Uncharacterized protein ToN1_34400 [Aromatoleum petrolei]|nr:Uncharacterized protein ToN1_34400 [Aromatoleum petrolei]
MSLHPAREANVGFFYTRLESGIHALHKPLYFSTMEQMPIRHESCSNEREKTRA